MFVCQRRRQSLQRLLSRLLKSGGLCHASVGLCIGSLFHVIARMDENMGDKRVGGEAVCRLLDTCTALAHAYNRLRPRGMTAGDMVLAADGMDLQTEEVPVPSAAMEEYVAKKGDYGSVCSNELGKINNRRVMEPIKRGAKNMFTLLVQDARCKGSDANLTQMYAAVGNMEIGGQRPALVACGRSLPTFRAYCPSSASRAVVLRSLMDGLRPSRESFVHTASARLGLVIGQLETPISGYNQHCIIRSLISVVVDNPAAAVVPAPPIVSLLAIASNYARIVKSTSTGGGGHGQVVLS